MARGEQFVRQWKLLRVLQTRGEGIPLKDLADEFGVSERTIQRDFELLEELGFPIKYDADEFGKRFWRMPHDFFKTGPFVLSVTEAVSLHLADHLLSPLSGTYLGDGLHTMLDKIRSQIPGKALAYFSGLDETVYVRRMGVTDYSEHAEAIRTLVEAARSEQTLKVRYRGIWRRTEYTTGFDPYGLIYYNGDLFVIGRSHRADDLRLFKITRILSVQETEQRFHRPKGFSLMDQFRTSFGILHAGEKQPVDITVRFTGAAATLVDERIWHESQKLTWLEADETLFEQSAHDPEILLAKYRLSSVIEFKRWIKGFGQFAEVVKPSWLRNELHDELLAAAAKHAPR